MAIDISNLFTKLGKVFAYQEAINLSRGTTIPPLAKAILDQFNGDSLELKRAIEKIEQSHRSFQSGASGAMSAAQNTAQNVIIETVAADVALPSRTVELALQELIRQMVAASDSVDASTVTAVATAGSSNDGDGVLVVSAKRDDGRAQEHILAETVLLEATGPTALRVRGELAASAPLGSDWPLGSRASGSLSAISPGGGLVGNGGFDQFTRVANAPDDWIVAIGTVGTTIKGTVYEVQQLAVTGPPTAGTYNISFTNADGKTQTTAPLAYDASGSTVQAALRALTGLSTVEVSTTGTSPLYIHTITFTGIAGNQAEITIANTTTGGTYTPSTVTAGSAFAYQGKALELDSDGSQLTALYRQITTLQPLTAYAVNLWAAVDSVPAAGVLTVDLVDGIGGTVINDEQGTANSFTIAATGLTATFAARNGVFRLPRNLPTLVYLRVRISTAVSNTTSVFLDHLEMVRMTALYSGGPLAALFAGRKPFRAGSGQVAADEFAITTTNDRAGEFQEWFQRNFDLAAKGLLLPSDSAGTETISDTLIA